MLFRNLVKFKIIWSLYVHMLKYYNLLSSSEAEIKWFSMPLTPGLESHFNLCRKANLVSSEGHAI
jgi:hypothetical protein